MSIKLIKITRAILFLFLMFTSSAFYAQVPIIQWVDIKAGTFSMGFSQKILFKKLDSPYHQVTLNSFRMSKYEITFAQYDAFCESTGRKKPDDNGWGRANRPVINVSWNDAKAFADWLGCRLPTEAEWEYACRAGTTTYYNTGSDICWDQANFGFNPINTVSNCVLIKREKQTMEVGSFPPNAWGLNDMHGNVEEWCSDWYNCYSVESQNNPTGPVSGSKHVIRGGAWKWVPNFCGSGMRRNSTPNDFNSWMGFRIVSQK